MAVYSITYDLYTPGQKHEQISQTLEMYNSVKAGRTHWLIESSSSADGVRSIINQYIDENDTLLVARLVPKGWTGFIKPNVAKWLDSPYLTW